MQYLKVEQAELVIAERTKPSPKSDECLIKVSSIGVNRADILQRQGRYPPPKGESDILGLEICGEVVEIGRDVKTYQKGDIIFGLVAGGAYAQYAVIKANHMMMLPKTMTEIQGGAIAEVFLTAYQSLIQLGQLSQHQKVLIHAGACGVGSAAIQIAKQLNCYVVVTVGNKKKAQACKNLGADQVIIHEEDDYFEVLKSQKLTFNLILDVVAGEYVNKNISLCDMDAKVIVLSMLGDRYVEQLDVAKMLAKRVHLMASTLRNQSNEYKAKLVSSFWQDFADMLVNSTIKPVIDCTLHWHKANDAHQILLANKNIGKVMLKVD